MRTSRRGMSGLTDPIVDVSTWLKDGCLDQANAATAALDQRTQNLAATWHPTGFYSPADVQQIVSETLSLVNSGTNAISTAPNSTDDAESQRDQAQAKLSQQGQRSMVYVEALRNAAATGATVLNAAGLKTWVLDSMQAVSSALVTAAVMECNMPWLASAIIAFQGYFDALASVVMRVVGVIVKVGDNVLDVADNVGTLFTVLKWGALIAGGAWLAMQFGDFRRRGW
jgi:hypothetical protein